MSIDRDETLKKAERLLKQGKVAAAIVEYTRLVEDKPSDWGAANALGDLYVKTGEPERAAEQFTRAADHLHGEGFFPRASALYKKVLKVRSDDDHSIWQLADIAGRNGLLLDARSYYARLIRDRRAAGNERGAVDCLVRLALLEDANIEAKRVAARALVEHGESGQAARLILSAADAMTKDGRVSEARELLQEAAQLDPTDHEIRDKLAAATEEPQPSVISDALVEAVMSEAEAATSTTEPSPEAPFPHEPESAHAISGIADDDAIVIEPSAVDAAAVLAEMTAAPDSETDAALPLESFFEELRGRVARDQAARAKEQYDRGVHHLQEERPAEAIANFEEAARYPTLRFEASAHLARIFLGRVDLPSAVEWMERALEAPAPTPDDRLALMYELGDTLGRQGETARALAVFMEIDSDAAGYRDVRDRIALMAQTRAGIGEA